MNRFEVPARLWREWIDWQRFFFVIASILFLNEINFLIKKVRADRSIKVEEDKEEMIEDNGEMMK